MKTLAALLILFPAPALALDCIPDPPKLTFGQKASDDWVKQCEKQFRNPLPTCHRLYDKPSDRELCLRAVEKIDDYYKQRPNHATRAKDEAKGQKQ